MLFRSIAGVIETTIYSEEGISPVDVCGAEFPMRQEVNEIEVFPAGEPDVPPDKQASFRGKGGEAMEQLLCVVFLQQEIVTGCVIKPNRVAPGTDRQVVDRKRRNWLGITSELSVDQFYDPVAVVGKPHIAFFVLQYAAVKTRREAARGIEDLLLAASSQPNDLIFRYQPTIARSIEIN